MPEQLGRYQIAETIGAGGFAIVYRGHDTALDRPVALKELRPVLLQDKNWVQRFQREARTIARLDHQHIVPIFDVHHFNDRLFIVMRLVEGGSLEDLLVQQGPLPWDKVLQIITPIGQGLNYAHTNGVLHRDLKPANILIDAERGPMLSDFGLAKLLGEHSVSLTESGSIVGTPHYIAPEVWEGKGTTTQSDIYALGCILYEMITGKKAAQGDSPPVVMMAHFSPLNLPETWPTGIPPSITAVLQTALARQPEKRYANAGKLTAALAALAPQAETSSAPVSKTSLPTQPTPFIGRAAELAKLTDLLNKPTCRLLTLLGPGGIGKTRLATQAAAQQTDAFTHGVCFVPLQAVETADFFVSAVADALNFPLAGQDTPATQLLNYLTNKEILLVLDNFEQLLAEQGQLILPEVVAAAPGVKLLVTSREALQLQEEWLFTVEGLSLPLQTQSENWADSEAVQLFTERARRVQPNFSPAAEREAVARICRLVEGMPLAIELAAAWTKMLTCPVIADEISRNLDILTSNRRNVPDRQQSMRAIFDQTWQQLSQPERDVFMRLSVFRGGFRRRAAEQVAGASLPLLSLLQDKALLRWDPAGRYHIHELLRQYAAEQLAQSPAELTRVKDLHCAHYTDFLHQYNPDFMQHPQQETIAAIGSELENIRAAWRWAAAQTNIPAIKKAARSLGIFCNFQSRYTEGLRTYENLPAKLAALPQTEETALTLANVLMAQSWLQLRFGRLDDIEAAMAQSQAIYRRLNREPAAGYITDPAIMLGFAALIRGDYAAAAEFAEQARQTGQRLNHPIDHEFACYQLAQAALAQGQPEAAQDYARQAHDIGQAAGDRWFLAYVLNTLGDIAVTTTQYGQAQQHYQAAFDIRREFNDAEGMALALNHLGEVAYRQAHHIEARRFFEQGLRHYQDINDQGGLATSHHGLGCVALALGDAETARQHFCRALQLASAIWYMPMVLTTLVSIGELLCRIGQPQRGIGLLVLVEQHPAASQETRVRTMHLRNSFKLQLRPKDLAAVTARTTDLESTIPVLLSDLPALDLTAPAAEPNAPPADPNQALVEPLTGRELDVLHLLAKGLSNQQIAERLTLAEGTVKYYTRQIYSKLQVRNRVAAVALAQELGLV